MRANNYIFMALIVLSGVVGCVSSERLAVISYSYFPPVIPAYTNAVEASLPPCVYVNPGEQIIIGEYFDIQNNVADPRIFLYMILGSMDDYLGTNILCNSTIQTMDGDEYQLAFQEGDDNQIEVSVVKNRQSCVARLDVPPRYNEDVCVWSEEPTEPKKMAKHIYVRRLK